MIGGGKLRANIIRVHRLQPLMFVVGIQRAAASKHLPGLIEPATKPVRAWLGQRAP